MPLLWLSLAFLAGILLADLTGLARQTWGLLCAGLLICLLLQAAYRRWIAPRRDPFPSDPASPVSQPWRLSWPLLLLALCLGAVRYQAGLPNPGEPAFIGNYLDQEQRLSVSGVIAAFPDRRDTYTNLRIAVDDLRPYGTTTGHTPVHGMVLVRMEAEGDFHYGERVSFSGYLETPPETESFSYREYLARQGIYAYISNARVTVLESGQGNSWLRAVYAVKEQALALVYQLWPDPEAGLFAGILLGVESGIPAPVQQAFKDTGTSHIIVISGFNITVVAALFTAAAGRWWGPYKGALAAVLGIAVYTILVGADAAVLRAALMGGLALGAGLIGRRTQGLHALALAAAIMAAFDPQLPWDVGFQLSVAATLGLVLYAEPLSAAFIRLVTRWLPEERARKLAGPVGEYLLFTLAAQLTTLPVMAYHFGRISWSALLANPLILPAQPPVMIVGGLALLLGLIWPPLGRLVAYLAWPFLLFTIRVVELCARTINGVLELGELSLVWVLLFYAVLLGFTVGRARVQTWLAQNREGLSRSLPVPLLAGLGVLVVLVWRLAYAAPDGLLHLTVLDVGTGEALLLQSPGGHSLLINGGPSPNLLSDGLGRRLPPFQRQLDWLLVGSVQAEDLGGLARNLPRFPPGQVLWAGLESPSRTADGLRAALAAQQVPLTLAQPGQVLDLGAGARLSVLRVSARGGIFLLEMGSFRALLPLGTTPEDLEDLYLGRSIGPVSVLLLADHGYAPLNPPAWIANLNPQLVLLPVAAGDPNGRPDPETLAALGGYSLLRTDRDGWIEISTDGAQMWIQVEKP